VNGIDERLSSMGGVARIRLESDVVSQAELEDRAGAIVSLLEAFEATLSRFRADSELSAFNRDPRPALAASPLLRGLARAARWAGARSRGLVDATLVSELEHQGYATSLAGLAPPSLDEALAAAPPRRPASAHPGRAYASLRVDDDGRVHRAPGVRLDSGGLGKGLAADLAAATVPLGVRYAIACGGDLAVGGPPGRPWEIAVTCAHTGGQAHRLRVGTGGVATSGIHARLWRRADGTFAHHLLDPAGGQPAWTGLVAVTAVASTALEAEVLAKTALLSGPDGARRLLRSSGGVLQHDDGRVDVIAGLPVVRLRRPVRSGAAA
jgi:thiamine biosynthesis lipoprotein